MVTLKKAKFHVAGLLALAISAIAIAGCGSASSSTSSTAQAAQPAAAASTATSSTTSGGGRVREGVAARGDQGHADGRERRHRLGSRHDHAL